MDGRVLPVVAGAWAVAEEGAAALGVGVGVGGVAVFRVLDRL
jgi:hypothetical protein